MEIGVSDRAQAIELAHKVKCVPDVRLPRLSYWNYDPCSRHKEPRADCEYQACGGDLFQHQRVGTAWMYAVKKGILADETGLGKTNHVIALCALLKERGQLTDRCLVVCQAPAVDQWLSEFARWSPRLMVEAGIGTRGQRLQRYTGNFDVLLVSYQMMLKDHQILSGMNFGILVADDVDPLRNHDTQTMYSFTRLSDQASRIYVLNATPLQTRLQELHALSVPLGGYEVFGPLRAFERRYVRQEKVTVYSKHTGRKITKFQTIGYKNMEEFKAKFEPFVLRRRYEDVKDTRMPVVAPPENVWLDLHPRQRSKYKELQKGVLKLLTDEGESVKHAAAMAKVMYGKMICAGMPALDEPDGPGQSVKLDWILSKLLGDWQDRKIVVFTQFKGTLRALVSRCQEEGIGTAVAWGEVTKTDARRRERERFWRDPNCRVFAGTASLERSLNLQVSNIVVNLDTHLNPARMHQILGRIRRAGSKFTSVYVFNLFTRNTQEEKYLEVLEKRQALADFVFEEENQLYRALSAIELLTLIRP